MEIDINTVKILRIILEKKLNILEKVKKGIDEKNLEEISQISLNMLK